MAALLKLLACFVTPFYQYLKRSNLAPAAMVICLCFGAYFIGVWQHGDSSSPAVASLGILCPQVELAAALPALSFEARHSSDAAYPAVGRRRFASCDAKYSEYTPCEDPERSWRFSRERMMYRERHCPTKAESLSCLVPAPVGYRRPFPWPKSREQAWFANVPHKELAVEKAAQNWIRVDGDRVWFPGGGTMFPHGADAYIEEIQRLIPLNDGSVRTAIDTGCGVASWGAYLLSRNIITMSIAPRDSHEAQVQFALERGVTAMIGVLASNRLPYPSRAFDMAHCSRCLIPWKDYDGLFLMEVDRILRPGGYWVLSGPPINWKRHAKGWNRTRAVLGADHSGIEDVARRLCWKKLKEKGDIAVWQKPTNHIHCKINRRVFKTPALCAGQDPDQAWYTKMEPCITPLPDVSGIQEISGGELKKWPERLIAVPPRIIAGTLPGVTSEKFLEDTELWRKRLIHYKNLILPLSQKGRYRNLLDMNANLGGFAAALSEDPVWVMNVVPVDASINTLGVIYERGLIGTYQNWCEAMSTYPRSYDLLHAGLVFSLYDGRCEMEDILLEMDRILRPEGTVIFRDDMDILLKVQGLTEGMRWESHFITPENEPISTEKILVAFKKYWTAPSINYKGETSDTFSH